MQSARWSFPAAILGYVVALAAAFYFFSPAHRAGEPISFTSLTLVAAGAGILVAFGDHFSAAPRGRSVISSIAIGVLSALAFAGIVVGLLVRFFGG